jgi:hypothetical protein
VADKRGAHVGEHVGAVHAGGLEEAQDVALHAAARAGLPPPTAKSLEGGGQCVQEATSARPLEYIAKNCIP